MSWRAEFNVPLSSYRQLEYLKLVKVSRNSPSLDRDIELDFRKLATICLMRRFIIQRGAPQFSRSSHALATKKILSPTPYNIQTAYDKPLDPFSQGNRLNKELVDLLGSGKFAAATRVLTHMRELSIPIHQHPVFEKAALDALQGTRKPSRGLFKQWMIYTPHAHHELATLPNKRPFQRIQHWIFETGAPSQKLGLVTDFGLILAYKGYHQNYVADIARLVTRYGQSYLVHSFVPRWESAVWTYYLSNRRLEEGDETPFRPRYPLERPLDVVERYRQTAVEMCIGIGRRGDAVRLVGSKKRHTLPDATYDRLLSALRVNAGGTRLKGLVKRVQRLRVKDARWRVLNEDDKKLLGSKDEFMESLDEE